MLKKDKIVSEAPGCKNRGNNNSNYNNISYNNDNVIVTASQYIENSGILFPGTCSHDKPY